MVRWPNKEVRWEVAIPGVDALTDELGLWQATAAVHNAEAFTVPLRDMPPEATDMSRWRIVLPDDANTAWTALRAQATTLQRAEQALPDADRRLRQFIRGHRELPAESFGAGPGGVVGRPEQALQAWLDTADVELSFSLLDHLPDDWQAVTRDATAFFERVRQSLRFHAQVESEAGGRRLGLSAVSWSGHIRTAWGADVQREAADQHLRSLELALHTRATWLRMGLLILRSSAQLAVLFPSNPLLAIPATWRFFKQVLELVRELPQQPSP